MELKWAKGGAKIGNKKKKEKENVRMQQNIASFNVFYVYFVEAAVADFFI